MTRILGMIVLVALAAGCTARAERVAFDGQFFSAKARKVDGQYDVFTVTVGGVSKSLDGAREAGGYEGVKYCINTYGNSDIEWVVGPDTPPEQLRIEKDKFVFQGVCPQ